MGRQSLNSRETLQIVRKESAANSRIGTKEGLIWMNIYLHVLVRQKEPVGTALTCPVRLSQVGNTAATSHTRMRH